MTDEGVGAGLGVGGCWPRAATPATRRYASALRSDGDIGNSSDRLRSLRLAFTVDPRLKKTQRFVGPVRTAEGHSRKLISFEVFQHLRGFRKYTPFFGAHIRVVGQENVSPAHALN